MQFTSLCNLLCNLGFLISYCIVFKNIMPYTLEVFGANPPDWLANNDKGQRVWLSIYCFILLFPCSLPRNLSALRFSSFLSFGISLFIVFTIFGASFRDVKADGNESHKFHERFQAALSEPKITVLGIFNSLPLIIFSFMYQPNIPAIYHELKKSSMFNMNKVLIIGTSIAVIAYIMAGLFGYVTFSTHP